MLYKVTNIENVNDIVTRFWIVIRSYINIYSHAYIHASKNIQKRKTNRFHISLIKTKIRRFDKVIYLR